MQNIPKWATFGLPSLSVILIFFLFLGAVDLSAQTTVTKKDSLTVVKTDSSAVVVAKTTTAVVVDSLALLHSPQRAALLSTILPGLGQAYNHKYWKIPLIYGGFAGLAYGIWWNDKYYQLYNDYYHKRLQNPTATIAKRYDVNYTAATFKSRRDLMRRNRDLVIICTGLLYVLNIVDATVDGYFYEYDISDDLSMKISPALLPSDRYATLGLTLSFNLN